MMRSCTTHTYKHDAYSAIDTFREREDGGERDGGERGAGEGEIEKGQIQSETETDRQTDRR